MTEERRYLAAADMLRVVCIGLIAWYHIWQQSWLDPGFSLGGVRVNLQQMVRHGYMMVDVLLVLSGFLLALPHARAAQGRGLAPKPAVFYLKRFWRIVPSYMLSVVLILLLWAIPGGAYPTAGAMVKDFLAHMTFTHNLFFDLYASTPLNGVLWTMAVEVQFYILFPLLARAYRKKPGHTCLGMCLAAFAFRAAVYIMEDSTFWVNQLPCMLDLYACGMGAAWLLARWETRDISPRLRRLLAAGSVLCLLVILQIMYVQTTGDHAQMRREQLLWRLPLGLLSGTLLVCGCLGPQGFCRAVGNPATQFLAGISYNYYIWHQFLACRLKDWHIPAYTSLLPNQAMEQPWQIQYTLLCFLAAGVAAAAITYLWEKPLYRLGTRHL
ncbi:MAG: acyltransferase [Oscillospiraceae bacterium]|nr:acyltransferase [Oscillospiraceae bacterium]